MKVVGLIFGALVLYGAVLRIIGTDKPKDPEQVVVKIPEKPKELSPKEQKEQAERQKQIDAREKLAEERGREMRARQNPMGAVSIEKFTWSKDGFDNVMIASLTIKNDNTFDIKDIDLICETSAASGTTLSHPSTTIYEIVPAKKAKRFTKVNVGFINQQSSGASCKVSSVVAN